MPTCYMLIGPMGCGKSTWCESMLPTLYFPEVISTDDLFEEVAARDGISYSEAFIRYPFADMMKKAGVRLTRAALRGHDIIIDQTNCTVESRRAFRHLIPQSYQIIGVVFEFEPELIRQRVIERGQRTGKFIPMAAVEQKMAEFTPPLQGEFDSTIIVPLK
jgi:predicted kinase